jgi:hypothetical protein
MPWFEFWGLRMIPTFFGEDGSSPLLITMSGSVGQGGINKPADVKIVQTLLNAVGAPFGSPLAVDGRIGSKTITAISKFQRGTMAGFADGRVDAPGKTIANLADMASARSASFAPVEGLELAKSTDILAADSVFSLPVNRIQSSVRPAITTSLVQGGRSQDRNSGFGAPFTTSGWTIDNNATTIDASVKDNGIFIAFIEVFMDDDPSIRQRLNIVAFLRGKSKGPPVGFDFSLPSFKSTKGTIIRGLSGFGPISRFNFVGVVNIGTIGISALNKGGGMTIFQFQWGGPAPPGLCMGFTAMVGEQAGLPGVAFAGGVGFCKFA